MINHMNPIFVPYCFGVFLPILFYLYGDLEYPTSSGTNPPFIEIISLNNWEFSIKSVKINDKSGVVSLSKRKDNILS